MKMSSSLKLLEKKKFFFVFLIILNKINETLINSKKMIYFTNN
jgi:hypothetical protein